MIDIKKEVIEKRVKRISVRDLAHQHKRSRSTMWTILEEEDIKVLGIIEGLCKAVEEADVCEREGKVVSNLAEREETLRDNVSESII